MKKIFSLLFTLTLVLFFFGGNADAAYLSQYDKEINIVTSVDVSSVLNEDTAQLSFDLQEAIISQYEKQTGTTFDHYYIWININGVKVLGIDPPVALY